MTDNKYKNRTTKKKSYIYIHKMRKKRKTALALAGIQGIKNVYSIPNKQDKNNQYNNYFEIISLQMLVIATKNIHLPVILHEY